MVSLGHHVDRRVSGAASSIPLAFAVVVIVIAVAIPVAITIPVAIILVPRRRGGRITVSAALVVSCSVPIGKEPLWESPRGRRAGRTTAVAVANAIICIAGRGQLIRGVSVAVADTILAVRVSGRGPFRRY